MVMEWGTFCAKGADGSIEHNVQLGSGRRFCSYYGFA